MKTIVKQCLGIDCAKDELVVCFGQKTQDGEIIFKSSKAFGNNAKEFKSMLQWSDKLSDPTVPLSFVVEATGVYHENLAYFLVDQSKKVSVVLPNKIFFFSKTLTIKTVNDLVAAKTIATFGLEKQLDGWEKPFPLYAKLKQLTREREQLLEEKTMNQNQLHAEKHSAFPGKETIKRFNARIALSEKQIKEIEKEIAALVANNPELKEKMQNVCSIPGVGLITAATVIAETNGFHEIRNQRQLVSYAGLDVVTKESGTSVHGKPHISKKGNKHLRKAMYFPALSTVKYDETLRDLYSRLENKHGIKMKGYVAVQRKLLVLIYSLWTKNEKYNPNYSNKKTNPNKCLEQPIRTALTELDQVRS